MPATLPFIALVFVTALFATGSTHAEERLESISLTPLQPVGAGLAECEKLLTNVAADDTACRRLAMTPGAPEAARAHSMLSVHAQRRGELDLAREHAESALALAPADGAVQSNYASLLVRQGRYADALSSYERALDDTTLTRTDIAALHLNRALCLRAMGRYDAAKTAYRAHESWLQDPADER